MDDVPSGLASLLRALLYDDRAVAWLQVDGDLNLIGCGGRLDHHGLDTLRVGQPAIEQAFFLQGMLPLAEPSCCLPSIELVEGRATDVHFHHDADTTWVLLLDVTASRDATQRLQQRAYEMTLLQEKEALLNRRLEAANCALAEAHRELGVSRDLLRKELELKQLELGEARTLQLALVPPPYEGVVGHCALAVDVVLLPANEVGGDLVDIFHVGDDLLVLLLGDVSGKGAGAALMMARTHALFRSVVGHPDAPALFRTPERAVRLVNRILSTNNEGCMFVTLLIAAFDGLTGQLTYTRAGHVPPFLRRAGGVVERLEVAGGLPLGIDEDAAFRSATIDLGEGDALLVVTDGATEAMDPSQRPFGDARIVELASQRVSGGAALLQRLLTEVRAFEAGSPPFDDLAAIVLRMTPPAGQGGSHPCPAA